MSPVSVLVSACLLGERCRWDGASRPLSRLLESAGDLTLVPVCPETEGGLGVPRAPACLEGGDGDRVLEGHARVIDADGEDRSQAFLRGARAALDLARANGCRLALLKERSPSCGINRVDVGGVWQAGRGVTAALLARDGLQIISDEDPALESILEELST